MRTHWSTSHRTSVAAVVCGLAVVTATGCGSSQKAEKGSDVALDTPKMTVKKKENQLVKRYDTNGDGKPNVLEVVERTKDPENPEVVQKRVVKKKVDLNGDGKYDIHKEYDDQGVLEKQTVDSNFDDVNDRISYYNTNTKDLKKKEILGKNGKSVVVRRLYKGEKLDQVKEDTDGDGKFDYFEYYKEGKLQRIGKDENADGEIDKWMRRGGVKAAGAGGGETSVPTPGGGGEGGGG